MAVVSGYSPRVNATGKLTSVATPDAFGSGVGAAMKDLATSNYALADAEQNRGKAYENVSQSAQNVANAIYKNEVQDDITSVHTMMAEARANGYETINKMKDETKPGDNTFVQRVGDTFSDQIKTLSQNVKTQEGQRLFSTMSSDMRAQFMSEAVGMQSKLNGEFATNQYKSLYDNYGRIVSTDNTQLDDSIARVNAAIDDKNSIFSRVDQSIRDKLKMQAADDLTMAAAEGFIRRHPGVVAESIPEKLRNSIQEKTNLPANPSLPPDLNADHVKPFTQDRISYVAGKIDRPSQYDETFKAAAARYNLDWRELKMRSVVESDLNPRTNSDQGAGGIMQMTEETAKGLGVNRYDPTDAIFGAARLLSGYKAKAGGDMAVVDQLYYGGPNQKQWGANTKQYAANLAAVRQSAGLAATNNPQDFANNGAPADFKPVKTGIDVIDRIKDPNKLFSMLQKADHYYTAYQADQERGRAEQNRLRKEEEDARANGALNRIIDPENNGGKLTSVDILDIPGLSQAKKEELIRFQHSYETEQGRETKDHPETFRKFIEEIYADESDPNKISGLDPILKAYGNQEISYKEFNLLRNEVTELRNGSTNGFRKDLNAAFNTVHDMFGRSIQGQINPAVAAAASYKFRQYAEREISRVRKENGNPYDLLDPNSKNYIMSQDRLQQFMPSAQAASSAAATNTIKVAANNESRMAEGGKKIGTSYPFSDGKSRIYLGGPLNSPGSWQTINPTSDK